MDAETCVKLSEWCNVLTDQFPNADGGRAHVVVSDFNFEDCFVKNCLRNLEQQTPDAKHTREEIAATIELLKDILTVPEAERIWPDDEYVLEGDDWEAECAAEDARRAQYRADRIAELQARR